MTIVWEHLNFNSLQDSAVEDHILSCENCFNNNRFNENSFLVILNVNQNFNPKFMKL